MKVVVSRTYLSESSIKPHFLGPGSLGAVVLKDFHTWGLSWILIEPLSEEPHCQWRATIEFLATLPVKKLTLRIVQVVLATGQHMCECENRYRFYCIYQFPIKKHLADFFPTTTSCVCFTRCPSRINKGRCECLKLFTLLKVRIEDESRRSTRAEWVRETSQSSLKVDEDKSEQMVIIVVVKWNKFKLQRNSENKLIIYYGWCDKKESAIIQRKQHCN